MKKLIYSVAALAGLFLAGSCQREELAPVNESSVVTFEVQVPEVATKSYDADGSNVNDLVYAVYSTEAESREDAMKATDLKFFYAVNETTGQSFADGKSIVSLELLKDQNYLVLFWAQSNDAWVNAQGSDINLFEVGYPTTMSANNEHLEAFTGVAYIKNIKGAHKEPVKLTRPFAQINLATTMPTKFTATLSQSSMTVKNAPASFNVAKQAVAEAVAELTFTAANVPGGEFKTGYQYAGANYIFAGENTTVDVAFDIYTSHGTVNNEVPSVPVAKNYKTNIIGNLLTAEAEYTVELEDEWEGEVNNDVLTEGLVKHSEGVYVIYTANGLAYASQNLFAQEGGSYVLAADIDMVGATSVPTKSSDALVYNSAKLTHTMKARSFEFDGKGYTIKNLPGMFIAYTGSAKSVVVKNLTLETPNVAFNVEDTPETDGVGAFIGYAGTSTTITLDNCHVKGGKIEGGHWTGGLVGYAAGYSGNDGPVFETLTIKDCSVKNATVTGKGSCGAIIGHATGDDWTLVDMDNIVVTSNSIISTGDSDNKAGSVMGTLGNAGQPKTVNGVTKTGGVTIDGYEVFGNTVKSNNVDNAKLWGRQGNSNGVLTIDGEKVEDFGNYAATTTVTVTNDAELAAAIEGALPEMVIKLAAGTYTENIVLTVAELGAAKGDITFKAVAGAEPIIAGTVTLGYRDQGVDAAMWNANVTFEGITFDHAEAAKHSISVGDVKSLTLKNCTIIGDGEYGIDSARGNATGTSKIEGCTFVNAAMQLLGNLATGLVIDGCTFNESRINVQAGNGVTVQNCTFNNTLKSVHIGDSFYCVRSNSTPITVKNSEINIDSELTEVITEEQAKWYVLANRGTTNWTVENVAVTMTEAALAQTQLKVTACTSTGVINTKNLTVNGKVYASTADQFTAAVDNGATDIVWAGEFRMPSNSTSKAITISPLNDNAVIDNTWGAYWENATLTFNGITIKTSTGMANGNGSDYAALYSKNVTYNNCNFSGPMRLGRDGANFNACTFNNLGNDYVWTYGKAATFNGCTFNTEGKALLIYSDGAEGNGAAPAVSVTNCTFNATQGAKAGAIANQNCAAVEIHNYGNGVTLTTSGNTVDSDFSGVWRIKTYEKRYSESKIIVNGTEYKTIALDGKTMTIDANKNVTVL